MSLRSKMRLIAICAVVLAMSPMVLGQATASFSGTVSDNTGAVVAGATVTVTAQATNISRTSKTDATGSFLVPLLSVGDYTVRVEAAGFRTAQQKDLTLQIQEQREVDFKLVPASVTTTVEVEASPVAVETANPSLGQVITSQEVADLPLNGRDFVQLATLTPGTTQETNPNSFFNGAASSEVSARGSYSLSVGGSRAQSTDWLLDGNDNNELTAGGIAILPSIDAIQEFKVLTYNYSAQYGTRAGPTVLVTTKSGSNQLHGTVFEFLRNTDLDAASYFASGKREQFNLNQFGAALGGALKKDKTFFFADYQGKRQRHGIVSAGLVPTAAMMTGDFTDDPFGVARPNAFDGVTKNADGVLDLVNPYSGSPFQCNGAGIPIAPNPDGSQAAGVNCNKIPSAVVASGGMADPAGAALIQLYPAANVTGNPNFAGINFVNAPVRKLDETEFDVRLDHNFSGKDSLFARFSYDQADSLVPGGSNPTGPSGFAQATPFGSTQNITNHGRNAAISETHIFSSNSVNTISGGFNRIFNFIKSYGYGSCEAQKIGIANANLDSTCGGPAGVVNQSSKYCVSCGLTSIEPVGGYWSTGDRGFAPFQGGTNVFSISDSFDMIRGKHDIHIGGEIRAQQMNVLTNAWQDGFFTIGAQSTDAMADLFLGLYTFGAHDQTFQGATTGRRWKMYRPYVQDDWRVTPNLTVNIGLAWALTTPVTENKNRQANFDFATGTELVPGVNSNGRVGIKMDKTAFEPRIGLAWKVLGSQKTALRAGYAIFHDSSWNQGAQGLWESPPYFAEQDQGPFFCGVNPSPFTPLATTGGSQCSIANGFLPITSPPNISAFQGTVQSQNLNFKQGRIQQFNLNVEQQLPGNVVLTVGYAGSRSSHILVDGLNWNVASPSACGSVAGYTLGCGIAAKPYPFFYVSNITDTGAARYDSLQVKAETKSTRHGLYMLLGYTWAKTYDSGLPDGLGSNSGATYWPLPGANGADWGLSQLNVNSTLTASVLYDLPIGKGKAIGSNWSTPVNAVLGGWQINLIERVLSGFPVFVYDSINQSGVGFSDNFNNWNRPNQTCSVSTSRPSSSSSSGPWFNTSCFTPAPVGELGGAPRAPLSGPGFVNTDLSLIKQFALTERVRLDFRAEAFNLFNHAQFGTEFGDIRSPLFGTVNSTVGNPRVLQVALKLKF